MGLVERRALAEYQEKTFPDVKKSIVDILGYEPAFDIHWDTLMVEGYSVDLANNLSKIYFEPLKAVLSTIGADAMGKKAIQDGLKKIVIDGSSGYSPDAFTFVDGTLTLQHLPHTNVDYVGERTKGLQKLLESKL